MSKLRVIFTFLILTLIFSVSAAPAFAFYLDDEVIAGNGFSTRNLNIDVEGTDFQHEDLDYLLPNIPMEKTLKVINTGNTDTVYSISASNFSGDINVCRKLELEVYFREYSSDPWESKTDSSDDKLYNYVLNALGNDTDMVLGKGDLYHEFKFAVKLPNESDSNLSLLDCNFDFVVKAWMPEFSYGTAYWDTEKDNGKLTTGDWSMGIGYETKETLEDEKDENPLLGFCPVTTYKYDSEHDGKALQEIKWDYIDGGKTYKVTEYKDTEDAWVKQWSAVYDETFSELKVDSVNKVVILQKYVPEGLYAHFIEVFDEDGNLIGSTYPETDKFTCTYEFIKYGSGDIVINEVMWAGSHDHELDEWIELRNTTDKEIDLKDWTIEGAGPSDHEITLTGKIPANGYYLVSHYPTDFDQGSDKAAINDQIEEDEYRKTGPETMNLADGGEKLMLKDPAGNKVDETPDVANGSAGEWAAGGEGNYGHDETSWRSMQRIELDDTDPGDGNDPENWYTCSHDECNDDKYWDDTPGDRNYGTPKNRNLMNTEQKETAQTVLMGTAGMSIPETEETRDSTPTEVPEPPMCIPDEQNQCTKPEQNLENPNDPVVSPNEEENRVEESIGEESDQSEEPADANTGNGENTSAGTSEAELRESEPETTAESTVGATE